MGILIGFFSTIFFFLLCIICETLAVNHKPKRKKRFHVKLKEDLKNENNVRTRR